MQVNTVEHSLEQIILVRENKSYIWWEKEREGQKNCFLKYGQYANKDKIHISNKNKICICLVFFCKVKGAQTAVPQVRKQGIMLNHSAFLILFLTGTINSRKQRFWVVKTHSVNNSLFLFKPFEKNLGKMSL